MAASSSANAPKRPSEAASRQQSPRLNLKERMICFEEPEPEVNCGETIGRSVTEMPSQYKQWIAQMHDQVALTLASGEMLGTREETRDQLEQILRDTPIVLYDKAWEDVLQHVTSKTHNPLPKKTSKGIRPAPAQGRGQSWEHPGKVNYRCFLAGCGKNTHRSVLSDGVLRCRRHFYEQRAILLGQSAICSSAGSAPSACADSLRASSSTYREPGVNPERTKRRIFHDGSSPSCATEGHRHVRKRPPRVSSSSSSVPTGALSESARGGRPRRTQPVAVARTKARRRSPSAHSSAATDAMPDDPAHWTLQDGSDLFAHLEKIEPCTPRSLLDPFADLLPCLSDPYAHSDCGSMEHGQASPRSTNGSVAGGPHAGYPSSTVADEAGMGHFSNDGDRLYEVKREVFHNPFTTPYSPPTEDNVEEIQDVRDFEHNYAQPRANRPNRFAPPPTPPHPTIAFDMQIASQDRAEDGRDRDDPLFASNNGYRDPDEPGGEGSPPPPQRRGKVKIVLSNKKRARTPVRKLSAYSLARRGRGSKATFNRGGVTYCRHALCTEWTWKESSFCERHTLKCTIANCDGLAVFEALSADAHGPAGIRCRTHYRYCTLPDCEKPAAPIVGYQSDPLVAFKAFCHDHLPWVACRASNCARRGTHSAPYGLGVNRVKMYCQIHFAQFQCSMCGNLAVTRDRSSRPPVLYCEAHVPQQILEWEAKRWQSCVVHKCKNTGIAKRTQADKLGPAGIRCKEHKSVCDVDGCWTRGHMKRSADEYGPAGMRCRKHGIRCNIPHCVRPAQQKQVADEFGPAGFRCKTHFRQCNIFGCERSGTFKMPMDMHGPSGYRCAVHRK